MKQATEASDHIRPAVAPLAARKVVFISHSNPEENEIAAWYGARLTAAGYEVWTDLNRLLGGEEMWLDIDEVLRFHARKVVAILSRAAADPAKDGVRAELDRAHTYRRKLKDRRFIIPLRIDDVPYDDLPPTISNRTIIPAGANHAAALARVIEILDEDKVPRQQNVTADALRRWQSALAPGDTSLEKGADELVSNWYELTALPTEIHFYGINRPLANSATEPATIAKEHSLPCAAHLRRLVAFAPLQAMQESLVETTPLTLDHTMQLLRFLEGGDDTIAIEKREAAKLLMSLLRQGFDGLASSRGLKPYALSERKTAWWIPKDLVSDGKVSFVRRSGTPGWRQLTGKYGARDRTWHFAINAVPMLGGTPRLRIAPHLIYTDPEEKLPPTAEFRRGHAKLWFNAKWRDLVYAMMAFLANATDDVRIPFGGGIFATLSSSAMGATLDVRPPRAFERKAKKVIEGAGDAEDLDVSDFADDPALTSLLDEEEVPDSDEAEEEKPE